MHLNQHTPRLAEPSVLAAGQEVSSIELRMSGFRVVLAHLEHLLKLDRKRPDYSELNEILDSKVRAATHRLNLYPEHVELMQLERHTRELLRVLPGILLSREWMSPSLDHSLMPQRGRYCEMVEFASFDYKRDRHREAELYEATFLAELRKIATFSDARCFLMSCGMSAIATAISFLRGPLGIKERFAAPSSLYFENIQLLDYCGSDKPLELPFRNTDELFQQISDKQPTAMFLDSIENSPGLRSVDLQSLVGRLISECRRPIFLVLDVTTTPLFSLPFLGNVSLPEHINILAVESLAKFHQFGLDVTTGGMITMLGKHPKFDLFPGFREKFGSNHSDVAASMLPPPDFKIAAQRFDKSCRNTRLIGDILRSCLARHSSSFVEEIEVSQPLAGSKHEQSTSTAGTPLLNIRFKNYSLLRSKSRLLTELVLAEAKYRGVNIISGTSFGFDTTRIYITAPSTDCPFLRVAPGIEDHAEALLVADSIAAGIRELEREYH